MEQVGWNYEHARPEGKTVYFFRDTAHISSDIQESILEELELLVAGKFITALFIEGCQGLYTPQFFVPSESHLKEALQQKMGRWLASEVFAYRHYKELDSGKLRIYGCDSAELLHRHTGIIQRLTRLDPKITKQELSEEGEVEFDMLIREYEDVWLQRSIAAAETVNVYMNSLRLATAGVIFGGLHFPQMTPVFMQKELGYISFFPGEIQATREEYIRYVQTF